MAPRIVSAGFAQGLSIGTASEEEQDWTQATGLTDRVQQMCTTLFGRGPLINFLIAFGAK